MLLAPHDMARFGFLFLHGGSWDGAQIVSGKWVSEATSPKMKVRGMGLIDGYGYNWWIGSGGFYLAIGRGGQWILIIPQYDMVIVMTGNSGSEGKVREKIIREFVLPAVMSDKAIPENPAAAQALSDLAGAAAAGSDVRLVTRVSDSPVAGEISGKTFILEKNVLGIDWLKIVFAPGSSTAELVFHRDGTGTSELSVGLDGIARRSAGRYGLPVFTRGAWISDSEFEIEMDEVANINRWKITARWDESGLRAEFKNLDGLPPVTLKGTPGM
jgi:hypothetical protein